MVFISTSGFFLQSVQAQSLAPLPAPGLMLPLSNEFVPTMVRGLKLHPDNRKRPTNPSINKS